MAKKKEKQYLIMNGEIPGDVVVWTSTSSKLLSDIERMSEDYGVEDSDDITVYEIAREFTNFIFHYPDPPQPYIAIKDAKGTKP